VNCFLFPSRFHSFSRSFLVFAFLLSTFVAIQGQVPATPSNSPTDAGSATDPNKTPDRSTPAATGQEGLQPTQSAEVLQARIEHARALIAAHRLDTAASELESVRAIAQDNALRNITSIMLMNVYLEEGNYGRAEALLEETYKARGAQKDESLGTYFALSGQAVNGARAHLARYRSFGVSTSDASLPAEALSDLNRLRSLLERMIGQAKEISNSRRAYDSLSLLEDVVGLRLSLARDGEDQGKWESEYVSAREALASSQTQVASLGGIPPLRPGKAPSVNPAGPSPYSAKRPADPALEANNRVSSETPPRNDQRSSATSAPAKAVPAAANQPNQAKGEPSAAAGEAGSLTAFATKRVVPRYPAMARQLGARGIVRVHVIVEGGKVITVSRSEGPALLRSAAEDAVRQWTFQAVSIEGQPTRLSGYIDFNFSL